MSNKPFNTLTFYGAAQEVTGSCHMLRIGDYRLLMDCGMHQGGDAITRVDDDVFEFDPAAIDAVLLSHAHLDHSGMLPKLVHEGFRGPILCTPGTRSLLQVLLEDAAQLYFRDIDYENERLARRGKPLIRARYSERDVRKVIKQCRCQRYGDWHDITDGLRVRFHDAGHILGSAIIEVSIDEGDRCQIIVYSGDLGNSEAPLMKKPASLAQADIVLMESTYGDRDHRPMADTLAEFKAIIEQAREQGGNILIPSFAVGRTQEILFYLGCFYHQGLLDGWQVFLDSPMAASVTDIYNAYLHEFDQQDLASIYGERSRDLEDFLPILTISESVDESMAINTISRGAIIIAGSGMCTGGRIRHHFKHRLWKKNNHLVFVGFQASGTLGRLLVDGARHIKLAGSEVLVKSQVHTLGGFSAHAGQTALTQWLSGFEHKPRVCLVHGEPRTLRVLADHLWEQLGIEAVIATRGASMHF